MSPIAIANTMRLNTKDKLIVNLELSYLCALICFLQKSASDPRLFSAKSVRIAFVFMSTQLVLDHTVCVTMKYV